MAPRILSRRRRPAPTQTEVENRAFAKALDAVTGAIIAEEVLPEGLAKAGVPAMRMPGTSWSNQGGTSSALIARVTQNLAAAFNRPTDQLEAAMASQGLTWGAPFPPGRPLDPYYGIGRAPRTWDFSVGENVQLTPRWNRVSFQTLKAIIETYDVAQVCIRHLINDVRSLDFHFEPPTNVQEDASEDIEAAEKFWAMPDRRQPFRNWLHEYLQDILRYDAGCLFVRRDGADRPIALEVVSGPTMIPLVDFFGRPPRDEVEMADMANRIQEVGGEWDGKTVPAFLQIIEGMPWGWHPARDIIYQPWNPMPDSQYGLAPMEAVLLSANSSVRYQWHILQYFTEGTVPAGFMEAPPEMSDPAQIRQWQSTWDALMLGDQAKLRQIRWVPANAKFTAVKPNVWDENFPLVFDRRTMASFGVTPNDLGWTEDVNRSTGDTQIDVQFRVGTLPLVRHIEDIVNTFTAQVLGLKARIRIDTGREVEDRLATAQADELYVNMGAISSDEVRQKLGKRTSRERPTPRYINNDRAGPVPLLAIESLAGHTDSTTFGPAQDQDLIDHPFFSAPGVAPVIGSDSHRAAQNATEAMQYNMIAENSDPRSKGHARHPDGSVQTGPIRPKPLETPQQGLGDDSDAEKALKEAYDIINHLLDRVSKDGPMAAMGADNTGGPGVTHGITAATGVEGVDLLRGDEDEEDEVTGTTARKWRENARNRVRKGQRPRLFADAPPALIAAVWPALEHATTREEVDAAFLGKAQAPQGAPPPASASKPTTLIGS